ncbi:unnamed protein product [Prorocentrum cordatum]|uniref:Uncharacterized protein n=1 Tax=Prorocentrum cordatum TaxID=2364126 RepID=A0ABN9WND4_9DINO|nr:unnamed protein product [Polarella glacialis]
MTNKTKRKTNNKRRKAAAQTAAGIQRAPTQEGAAQTAVGIQRAPTQHEEGAAQTAGGIQRAPTQKEGDERTAVGSEHIPTQEGERRGGRSGHPEGSGAEGRLQAEKQGRQAEKLTGDNQAAHRAGWERCASSTGQPEGRGGADQARLPAAEEKWRQGGDRQAAERNKGRKKTGR